MKGFLGGVTGLMKVLAVVLAVGSGLSIGKEATLVHIACCVANVLMRIHPYFLNNPVRKREMMSAAAAAGMSVAVRLIFFFI
jgi:chloride channel 3/4/5